MGEQITSPDGKYLWTGDGWIPLPNEENIIISDSVVMGDINQNISINKTDNSHNIENMVKLYIEKIQSGDTNADQIIESAKKKDLVLTNNLIFGSYAKEIVESFLPKIISKTEEIVHSTVAIMETKVDGVTYINNILVEFSPLITREFARIEKLRSSKLDWDITAHEDHMEIESIIMELKACAKLIWEASSTVRSLNTAKIETKGTGLAGFLLISDLLEPILSIAHTHCDVPETVRFERLHDLLPDIEDASENARIESLEHELEALKLGIKQIERMPVRISIMPYSGEAMVIGEMDILFKHREIRGDLTDIILHIDFEKWNPLKTLDFDAKEYDSTVSLWMAEIDEIREYLEENPVKKKRLTENELTQVLIFLEASYLVSEMLGKIATLFRPAFGKLDALSGRFCLDLYNSMATVFTIIKSTRYLLKRCILNVQWEELKIHPRIINVRESGDKGLNKYRQMTSTRGSAPGEQECFIATAAYGSNMEPKIEILRNWRDHSLREFYIGRQFIQFYYSVSPKIAGVIARWSLLRVLTRIAIAPLIFIIHIIS